MDGVTPLDVWAAWCERACAVNEYAAPSRERRPSAPRGVAPAGAAEDGPGTDFNRRGSWDETGLFEAGWTWERQSRPDAGLLTRPGKECGVSGTIGLITSKENGWPLFWCFSTSAPEFVPETPYTRFGVFATLRHAGDYEAAARDLASRGYGRRMPEVGEVKFGSPAAPPSDGDATNPAGPPRIFKWMSELQHREENDKWLWHGYLSRGGVTMLSALWKAGKSTLLSHLLKAFDGGQEKFLGLPIVPSRVLYVSEEHEELWADRRDELGIRDHVGMACRPFRGRQAPAEWAAFIGDLVKAVQANQFDLVVMDTISKLWPVREENDAGQVEDALMPLWNITNGGTGLLLVHHNRKSDGKEFTGSRGSGGLPAFCETLIEFRRNSDNSKDRKRLLGGGGRYKETPDKLLIELLPSGYVSHGDPDEMTPDQKIVFGVGDVPNAEDWTARAMAFIPDDPMHAKTADQVIDHLGTSDRGKGARRKDVAAWLAGRVDDGELIRFGRGVKGSPHRFCKPGDSDAEFPTDPLEDESGTESETECDPRGD